MPLAKKTATGAAWIVLWRVVSRSLGVVSILVLARLLPPEAFGLVAIATSVVTALDTFSILGWQDAIIRSKEYNKRMLNSAFTICTIRGLVMGLLIAAGAPFAAQFFGEPRIESILYLLAVLTVLEGFENVGVVEFRRELQFNKEFILFVVPRFVAFAVTILSAFLLKSYWALVLGIATQRLCKFAIGYLIHPHRPQFSTNAVGDLLSFSLWTWAISTSMFVRDRFPSLIIGRVLGPTQVGQFTIGWEIAMLPITELVQPIERALFSGFSSAARSGSDLADLFTRAAGVVALFILPMSIGMSALSDLLVSVALGAAWQDASPLIMWLSISTPFFVLASLSITCLIANARLREALTITTCSGGAILALSIALIGDRGLQGVMIAILIVMVLEGLTAAVLTVRWLGGRPSALVASLWRSIASVLVMAAVLDLAGLGWIAAPEDFMTTIYKMAETVTVGATSYIIASATLWLLCGKPVGAESWLIQFATETLGSLRRRLES